MTDINETFLTEMRKMSDGTVLALQAVAEQLQKQNDRFEDEDLAEEEKEKALAGEEAEEAAKGEYDEMMKSISGMVKEQVTAALAPVLKQLIDLGGDKAQKVRDTTKWPMTSNPVEGDGETKVDPRHATTEVQKPIQAQDLEDEKEKTKDDVAEYPMEEDKYKDVPAEMAKAHNALKMQLKKALDEKQTLEQSIDTRVQKAVDTQLQKLGFRKEVSRRPSMSPDKTLGLTDIPIVKSKDTPEVTIDDLAKLSYSQLWQWHIASTQGKGDSVPKELLG